MERKAQCRCFLPLAWQVGSEVRSAGGHSFYREILLMSLFYLIEEHNRVGAPWNSFEGLTVFFST